MDIAGLNAVVDAQRPADPGELRAALRPGRPVRPARAGHHLLRHRQQPRPVLLPPLRARWSPASVAPPRLDLLNEDLHPLARPRDLARRGRPQAGPGDPGDHRHGRHRAGGQAAAGPARCALHRRHRRGDQRRRTPPAAPSRARTRCCGNCDGPARPRPRGGTRSGSSTWCAPRPRSFDRAFDRWRDLFRAALVDQWEQNRRRLDHSLSQRDRDIAGAPPQRGRDAAARCCGNEDSDARNLTADFNPYRYLASEGFLPGYSFPRLPIAAYIPVGGRSAHERRLRAAAPVPGHQGVRPAAP